LLLFDNRDVLPKRGDVGMRLSFEARSQLHDAVSFLQQNARAYYDAKVRKSLDDGQVKFLMR